MVFDDFIKYGTWGRFHLVIHEGADMTKYTLEDYEDEEIGCKIQ